MTATPDTYYRKARELALMAVSTTDPFAIKEFSRLASENIRRARHAEESADACPQRAAAAG